jgi:hypothetical protein
VGNSITWVRIQVKGGRRNLEAGYWLVARESYCRFDLHSIIYENSGKTKDPVVAHLFFVNCINVFKMKMENLVMETITNTF